MILNKYKNIREYNFSFLYYMKEEFCIIHHFSFSSCSENLQRKTSKKCFLNLIKIWKTKKPFWIKKNWTENYSFSFYKQPLIFPILDILEFKKKTKIDGIFTAYTLHRCFPFLSSSLSSRWPPEPYAVLSLSSPNQWNNFSLLLMFTRT